VTDTKGLAETAKTCVSVLPGILHGDEAGPGFPGGVLRSIEATLGHIALANALAHVGLSSVEDQRHEYDGRMATVKVGWRGLAKLRRQPQPATVQTLGPTLAGGTGSPISGRATLVAS